LSRRNTALSAQRKGSFWFFANFAGIARFKSSRLPVSIVAVMGAVGAAARNIGSG
jgi:hypothetical protein